MCGNNDMNISNLFELENNISEQYIRFIIRRNSNLLCSIRSFSSYSMRGKASQDHTGWEW